MFWLHHLPLYILYFYTSTGLQQFNSLRFPLFYSVHDKPDVFNRWQELQIDQFSTLILLLQSHDVIYIYTECFLTRSCPWKVPPEEVFFWMAAYMFILNGALPDELLTYSNTIIDADCWTVADNSWVVSPF